MNLTPSQLEAAHTVDRPVAVIASAGSGKTRVLIERYKVLVSTHGIPFHKILAFTFTEKAADEIKTRILQEKLIEPEEEALIAVSTIHAFLSKLLRRHGPLIGLDPQFIISNETGGFIEKATRVKNHLLKKLNSKDKRVSDYVRQFGFVEFQLLFQQLLELPLIYPEEPLQSVSCEKEKELLSEVYRFFADWQSDKIKQAQLHFDDLEFLSVELLTRHPEIRSKLTHRYQHILVDEFQDTSPLQGRLVNLLHEPGVNTLFIVGDPKQSIYRFRKADLSIFNQALHDITALGGKIIDLPETFRMPPLLTSLINKVFEPSQPAVSKKTDLQGKIHLVIHPRGETLLIHHLRQKEAEWIADQLIQRNLSPEERNETALLFRTGAPISIYRNELEKRGIPCSVTRTEHLLRIRTISDLCHLLAYLAGETNPITMVGILRSSFFKFSETFIERFRISSPSSFLSPFIPDLFISGEDLQKWSKLTEWITRWEKLKTILAPHVLFELIVKDMELFQKINQETRLHALQWLQLIADLEQVQNPSLKDIHRMLKTILEQDQKLNCFDVKSASGTVHLMTLHAAKGLEFKRVFLPQLFATPSHKKPHHLFHPARGLALKQENPGNPKGLKIELEESPLFRELAEKEETENKSEIKRLLYVAMTRAEEELFLFLKEPGKSSTREEDKNWNQWLWELLEEERKNAIIL